jgi:hypothetical protein
MVYMPDRADVDVGFGSLILFLCHLHPPLL